MVAHPAVLLVATPIPVVVSMRPVDVLVAPAACASRTRNDASTCRVVCLLGARCCRGRPVNPGEEDARKRGEQHARNHYRNDQLDKREAVLGSHRDASLHAFTLHDRMAVLAIVMLVADNEFSDAKFTWALMIDAVVGHRVFAAGSAHAVKETMR